jgi:NAD-dependent dihydropyrimidine dehydrogenase PreA subunit
VRADGTFIALEVDDAVAGDAELARRITEACPVDIFAQDAGGPLRIVEQNLDECVLCRLCLDAVASDPTHPVKVIKLYDEGALLS